MTTFSLKLILKCPLQAQREEAGLKGKQEPAVPPGPSAQMLGDEVVVGSREALLV